MSKPLKIVNIASGNGTASKCSGPVCGGCRHWDDDDMPRDQRGVQVGKCRRNPPTVVGTFFPVQAQGILRGPNQQAVQFHLQSGTIWYTPAADDRGCGEWVGVPVNSSARVAQADVIYSAACAPSAEPVPDAAS